MSLVVSFKVKYTLAVGILAKRSENIPTQRLTRMFKTALFMMAENWKQPKCQSVGEWVNKIHNNTDESKDFF